MTFSEFTSQNKNKAKQKEHNPGMTQRYCYALDLKNDATLIEQYKKYHENETIWPEIVRGIKQVGILNMEIWNVFDRLFMIVEVPSENFDIEKQMKLLATLERQEEWEEFMSQFQKTLPQASNGEKWIKMEKIFQL